eukprot:CAMPEP_0176041676 /NCGR_PEP_ID=MMETSP0120_2-20121206/20673_1 /TAXON_ID=160619 /ORGANISM="Kryptoperidinium foliaceum, Strain CCMP 1326" /LENGTH=172 /DNA_ID=CAMNT_0017375079 /DNA_START=162 /DNA_END=679 /DNA_ORIENTATION=-
MNATEYDQFGRLSQKDELMLAKPATNLSCDKEIVEPEQVQTTSKLSSTPEKHNFMHQENMKRIEMPQAIPAVKRLQWKGEAVEYYSLEHGPWREAMSALLGKAIATNGKQQLFWDQICRMKGVGSVLYYYSAWHGRHFGLAIGGLVLYGGGRHTLVPAEQAGHGILLLLTQP